ncbi:hypothetical protein AVEN_247957-1 [Araneus ventricosus]|uniref:Uncharacterized protein n=1 Tax=Araneus ventricosus TaxID=182803 RepID=A0A4Y2CK30_ARAVE|nr:hypothetical protein AVEN_247957-1 [Araneus ventricosus]
MGSKYLPPVKVRTSFGRGRAVVGDDNYDSGLSTRAIAAAVIQFPRVPRQDEGSYVKVNPTMDEPSVPRCIEKALKQLCLSLVKDFTEGPEELVLESHFHQGVSLYGALVLVKSFRVSPCTCVM